MAKTKEKLVYPVDPIDAQAAISDIQDILRNHDMSTTDLAVELGWKRTRVEEFLYGVDIPNKGEFEEVAKVLNYELDI